MAQADYIISNQTFPNTRADINSHLQAIATNNSGTSAPTTQYAGQFWIDTTSSTWTLYIHDGSDDIQFATIDTSANTVNFTDSALDVVTDTTPQLGGNLDLNSSDITGTGNINITGTVTATSFSGDGSSLTGIASDVVDDTTPQLGGDLDLNSNDITGTGNINITGNLTSTGIDDNATSTAIQINSSDQVILYGQQIQANNNTSNITYSGGNNSNAGANLTLFGGSHATTPNVARFRSSATEVMRIDSSGKVGIGTSSPSRNLHINASQPYLQLTSSATGTTSLDGFQLICSQTTGEAIIMQRENANMSFYTNNTERMSITSDGRLRLATASNMPYGGNQVRFSFEFNSSAAPYYGIEMKDNGSAGTTYGILFSRSSLIGSISYNASSVSYNTTSDYRLKNNISDVLNAIDRVKQLKPIRFNFISEPDKTVDGFLAHEVQEVVPEAIVGEKDAVETYIDDDGNEQTRPFYQGIDQSKLVPLLTAGLQEAITKIETLEARITALENK